MTGTARRSLLSLFLIATIVFAPGTGSLSGTDSIAGDARELAARMLAPTHDFATKSQARPTLDHRSGDDRAPRPAERWIAVSVVFASLLLGVSWRRMLHHQKHEQRTLVLLAPERRRAPPLLQPA